MFFIEILKAIFLGIVEGITEWLPISSTGHMILVDEFIKLDVSKEFLDMFMVVIQLGAILAVLVLYFHKLNPFSRKKTLVERKQTWSLWLKVIIACLPAAVIGLIFDDKINELFFNAWTIAITLIVYASITDLSVSKLFVGSVIPGILMAIGLIIYALFYGKKNDLPAHERKSAKEVLLIFKDSIWALLMPVIILGGIFGGIFTPTESAAVAVVYALLVSLLIYKDIKIKDIPGIFVDGAISTATILMLVGISKSSGYVITTSGLPHQVLEVFSSFTNSTVVILLLLNILFLVIGMLMEANAAIIMMTPILLPLLDAFGIDPLQFGIMMSFNLCIGLVTPPVGICLLMTNQIAEARFVQTLKSVMPMLLIGVVVLMLVTYIPQVTTFLPGLIK